MPEIPVSKPRQDIAGPAGKLAAITSPVDSGIWRLGSTALVLAFVAAPLGNAANAIALALLLAAALQVVLANAGHGSAAQNVNRVLLFLAVAIIFIAALQVLNPNIPTLQVGLVGFRKSATFLLGAIIGVGWLGNPVRALRLAWWCLYATAVISLVVHFALPSLEQAITRQAGAAVVEIGDSAGSSIRMQGLLAGPFHISLMGTFLFLSAIAPGVISNRILRLSAAGAGFACVFASGVRTGFVALAIGALVIGAYSGSVSRFVGRIVAVVIFSVIGFLFRGPIIELARTVPAIRYTLDQGLRDRRFTGRMDSWSEGLEMVGKSPLIGYGSGSSGDSLERYFARSDFVVSHNAFLKYFVEGGMFQGFLFISLCIGFALAIRPGRDSTRLGLAAGIPMLVFAMTGSAVEAIPVSLGLAVILGLCSRPDTSLLSQNPAVGAAPQIISEDLDFLGSPGK